MVQLASDDPPDIGSSGTVEQQSRLYKQQCAIGIQQPLCPLSQTSIEAEGFRSLREGETVEYEVEAGEDGRTKAVKVTGPDGATPQVRLGGCRG